MRKTTVRTTAHTLNETPCIVVAPGFEGPLRPGGALCELAADPARVDGHYPRRRDDGQGFEGFVRV